MYRGTTPTFTFLMPFELSTISNLWCTFKQVGESSEDIVKQLSAFTQDATNKKLSVQLTQSDTLSFVAGKAVSIQMRIKFTDNNYGASQVMHEDVLAVLQDGVLS